ncbi:DUF2577 domain-containing protein [Paenibacillus sp. B01]|uniref:DUF2577 domain-containing protein n=1 Tax=Paenibacillus sp. B01 TaxID=2660554 RepID=UPI00129A8B38|nr:DUF2577 domain-containing protein [Paenibacillus sp. B01]QGG57411.1 DUF2577 domain-containing protein [Paenibacillus sp. B01]
MSINDSIKQIMARSLEAQQLTKAVFGKVTGLEPLEVAVEQRFTLPAELLVVPEHLRELAVELGGERVVLRRGLELGDRLVLLRSEGGSPYVALGRVEA